MSAAVMENLRGVQVEPQGAVGVEQHHAVSQFLFNEVRLLADERFEEWLSLFTPNAHYWMPGIENRYRRDKAAPYYLDSMAFFDDDLASLEIRVKRLQSGQAWPEDPKTRHVLTLTNIEVFEADLEGHLVAFCNFLSFRSKGERDTSTLHGTRKDVLKVEGNQFRIAQRRILLAESLLSAKNLNVFL